MKNFLQHKKEIIDNFCNTFKKLTYKTLWGIDLNCNTNLPELVWLEKMLLYYQQVDDCCKQCTLSHLPKNCILSQLAIVNPNPTLPFIQLTVWNNAFPCTYINQGDFNNDFNNDFFL